jgi:hypothetical protein
MAGTVARPLETLCAIRSGSAQCYGHDGCFDFEWLPYTRTASANLGGSGDRAVALEAWSPKLYPMPPLQDDARIEGDNGALWIARFGGIR